MEARMTAIEMIGRVDEQQQLHLEGPLPVSGPMRVRVIILYPSDTLDETEWPHAATHNPAFEDLFEPDEDIYSMADGKPFHDQV